MAITALPANRDRARTDAGTLLRRGALAGLGGGAAMAAFLLTVGEPSIRRALALEAAAHPGAEPDEMFSRSVQTVGGVLAAVLYGVLIGAIFAVGYAVVARRARTGSAFRLSLGLGMVGFLAVVLVPGMKYPANPPGVGDPDTVGQRTTAYITLLAASLLLAVLAWRAWAYLRDRGIPEDARAVVVALAWFAAVGAAYLAWPATPDPVTVPAQLLWRFRLQSLGGALLAWLTIASVFAWMTSRPEPHTDLC